MRTDEIFGRLRTLETECRLLEERIEEVLRRLERRDAVAIVQAPDFGKQKIALIITLDEFNVESAETFIREAVMLAKERFKLRKEMWELQRELESQNAFMRELQSIGLGKAERRVAIW